jgi:hypothetical protein
MTHSSTELCNTKISNFFRSIDEQSSVYDACQMINEKANNIKNSVDDFKRKNPTVIYTYYINNLENLLPNSHYTTMLGYKTNSSMIKYYNEWFDDIEGKFGDFICNDNNAMRIINDNF